MKILGGYTGFVGSNIQKRMDFDLLINSSNVSELQGREADLLIWSGVKAEKWKANLNPEEDRQHVESVAAILKTVKAKQAILISTVDVYPSTSGADESTKLSSDNHAYGRHRLWLEQEFRSHFKNAQVIRLPGLFGDGLKKNMIFDFFHKRDVSKIPSDAFFQFYCLDWIADDIKKVINEKIDLVNLVTEPVRVDEVVETIFQQDFVNQLDGKPIRYDLKSVHSQKWGHSAPGYLYVKSEVLAALKNYIERAHARGTT